MSGRIAAISAHSFSTLSFPLHQIIPFSQSISLFFWLNSIFSFNSRTPLTHVVVGFLVTHSLYAICMRFQCWRKRNALSSFISTKQDTLTLQFSVYAPILGTMQYHWMYGEKIFGFYAVAAAAVSSLAALLLRRLHFTDAFMRHVLVSVCVCRWLLWCFWVSSTPCTVGKLSQKIYVWSMYFQKRRSPFR